MTWPFRNASPGFVLGLFTASLLLIYTCLLHFYFLHAIPDPIFHLDSASYVRPVLDFIFTNHFALEHRTPGYSLFLLLLLGPTKQFYSVLIVQHMLAIISGFLAGILYYRHFSPSWVQSAAILCLTAALPKAVIASHSIATETLYTSVFLLSLLIFLEAKRTEFFGSWLLLGVAVSSSILIRPVGWSLLMAILVAGSVWSKNKTSIIRLSVFAVAVSFLLGTWCTFNYFSRGFFGVDQFTGISLFGYTARFLDPRRLPDSSLESKILTPLYEKNAAHMDDRTWVMRSPEGPTAILAEHYRDPRDLNRVLTHLAWVGIRSEPVGLVIDQSRMFFKFIFQRSGVPGMYMNREFTFFVYRGILLYAKIGAPYPVCLAWISHRPEQAQERIEQLHDVMKLDAPEAERRLNELDSSDVYPYTKILRWWIPLMPLLLGMKWLPLCALIGSIVLFRKPTHRFQTATLCCVIFFHIILTNLGADEDPRHAIPIEPLYWLLVFGGISCFFTPRGRPIEIVH